LLRHHDRNSGDFNLRVAELLNNIAAALAVCYHATAVQPLRKHLELGLPDVSMLSPQLQLEWHPVNNTLLGNIKVKPHSNIRVMWSCPNCPAGCPHLEDESMSAYNRHQLPTQCREASAPAQLLSYQSAEILESCQKCQDT
jgi:hypothetical protein